MAFKSLVENRPGQWKGKPELFNTDQGSQFTSMAFTGPLIESASVVEGKEARPFRRQRMEITLQNSARSRYIRQMTSLLEQALEKVQALPAEMQDEAARMLLVYAGGDDPVIELTAEEEADLIEAQAEVARGEIATSAEVAGILSKYRL